MELEKREKEIISHFRKNARMTLTKMSRKTKIPVSTIFDKLKKYKEKIINKHTTLIDFTKLGYLARAQILIKSETEEKKKLRPYLKTHPAVNTLYKVNNGYDYMIEAVFKNVKELDKFLEKTETKHRIESKKVYYVIEDIAREKFMSAENFVPKERT